MSSTRILNYIADSISHQLLVSSIASVAILFREGGEGKREGGGGANRVKITVTR